MATSSSLDLSAELAVAQEAARNAGAYLLQRLGTAQVQTFKAARDAQLDVDLAAESLLLDAIRSTFPEDAILSEEADSSIQAAPRRWIIDPLDGSFNFQHNSALFGVAIALQIGGTTRLGVIYLPTTDEMYTVILGQGACCNGLPFRISRIARLSEAIVHVSDFSPSGNAEVNAQRLQIMSALAPEVGRIRMIGTAAGDFAWLARGRADGLIMYNTYPWDIEAGALLVEEAGGIVTRVLLPDGSSAYIGSNRLLHQDMLALLSAKPEL